MGRRSLPDFGCRKKDEMKIPKPNERYYNWLTGENVTVVDSSEQEKEDGFDEDFGVPIVTYRRDNPVRIELRTTFNKYVFQKPIYVFNHCYIKSNP